MPRRPAVEECFPAFSPEEMDHRWSVVRDEMARRGADVLLVFGNRANHHEVLYLSGFQVSNEAVLLLPLDGDAKLLVSYTNHVSNARRVSWVEVAALGHDPVESITRFVPSAGTTGSVAVTGPLSWQRQRALASSLGADDFADFGPFFARLRLVKSEEELARIRFAARLSDAAIDALTRELRPGLDEYELGDIVEHAYRPQGGGTHIHYIGVTSMAEPDLCVPAQLPTSRRVREGDVVLTEISALAGGYFGQVLRTFAVAAEPTPLYREMHKLAVDVFDRISETVKAGAHSDAVLDVADSIDAAGYAICDDLLHAAVGGVYAPCLRTRQTGSKHSFEFEEDMVIVVQPNVVTRDERTGVQFGEMLRVTHNGVEALHNSPRKLIEC